MLLSFLFFMIVFFSGSLVNSNLLLILLENIHPQVNLQEIVFHQPVLSCVSVFYDFLDNIYPY